MKKTYTVNGKVVSAEEFLKDAKDDWLEGAPMTSNTYSEHDPLLSDGMGCMKGQVSEMRETIKKHSIQGVRVKDSGQLEITSRRGRRELLKVRGLADADGMYGD